MDFSRYSNRGAIDKLNGFKASGNPIRSFPDEMEDGSCETAFRFRRPSTMAVDIIARLT
jgi:hypothetical protein